ncbi:MAG TPA: hypothetical protein VG188_12225 [Solirubrobacteraceae bacterium]|jgi:hypothetical protein|nr:hypothetical protein [Solirubrobacteraceae bacterium]
MSRTTTAATCALPCSAPLAIELDDGELDRLRQRGIERFEQAERAHQLDERDALHRLPALEALQRCPPDPGLLGQLRLRLVALQAMALQAASQLHENSFIGQ